MPFPEPLVEIADFLRNSEKLANAIVSGGDGRAASRESEDRIIGLLQNQNRWRITSANVGQSHNRAHYDFTVECGSAKLYVDLKVSTLKGQDNTNCKPGIYHALTGRPPEEAPTPYGEYFHALAKHAQHNDVDFYFLVIGKGKPPEDPKRAFVCSLRTLPEVVANGNNPPFQCNWSKCLEPVQRSYEEAKRFLLGHYRQSLKQRAEPLEIFEEYFDIESLG